MKPPQSDQKPHSPIVKSDSIRIINHPPILGATISANINIKIKSGTIKKLAMKENKKPLTVPKLAYVNLDRTSKQASKSQGITLNGNNMLNIPKLDKNFDAKQTKTSTSLDDGIKLKDAQLTTSKVIRKHKPKVKSPSFPMKPPVRKVTVTKVTAKAGKSQKAKLKLSIPTFHTNMKPPLNTVTQRQRVRTKSLISDNDPPTIGKAHYQTSRSTPAQATKRAKRKHSSMFKSPGSSLPKKTDLFSSVGRSDDFVNEVCHKLPCDDPSSVITKQVTKLGTIDVASNQAQLGSNIVKSNMPVPVPIQDQNEKLRKHLKKTISPSTLQHTDESNKLGLASNKIKIVNEAQNKERHSTGHRGRTLLWISASSSYSTLEVYLSYFSLRFGLKKTSFPFFAIPWSYLLKVFI